MPKLMNLSGELRDLCACKRTVYGPFCHSVGWAFLGGNLAKAVEGGPASDVG